MKKKISYLLFFIIFSAGYAFVTIEDENPDPIKILKKSEKLLRSETYYAQMKIQTIRPKYTRKMELKTWAKGKTKAIILIASPAKEKGTVFLKLNKQVWNWVPAIERTIKMPPSMMGQSWMGTDMTNDDLVQQSSVVDDYTCVLDGDTTIEDRDCYKIVLTPKENAAVIWGKVNIWVTKVGDMQVRHEFYDEDDDIVNVMEGQNIQAMGGKTMPTKMVMIPMDKEGHKTILEYIDIRFDEPIEDSFFSVQNIKKVK